MLTVCFVDYLENLGHYLCLKFICHKCIEEYTGYYILSIGKYKNNYSRTVLKYNSEVQTQH